MEETNPTPIFLYIIAALIYVMGFVFLFFRFLETLYAHFFRRPLFIHFYLFKRRLPKKDREVLKKEISFYRRLSPKYKRYFEHRVACFIADKDFSGRGVEVTKQMKVMIASSAVILTFGMRNYLIQSVSRIIIYPAKYFSELNRQEHVGEFNPGMKTIVFSWVDFLKGFEDGHDNLNLGLHEFAHALNFNSFKQRDIGSRVFKEGFLELRKLLNDDGFVDRLQQTQYFRDYAHTNEFEFLAVAIEHLIETPSDFKSQEPRLYEHFKKMLNLQHV